MLVGSAQQASMHCPLTAESTQPHPPRPPHSRAAAGSPSGIIAACCLNTSNAPFTIRLMISAAGRISSTPPEAWPKMFG